MFEGLIPADRLAAAYDLTRKTLYLSAEGSVTQPTSRIHFQREPWNGGLKFALLGWVGPATAPCAHPYRITQHVHIDLRSKEGYPREIVVTDLQSAEGEPVPVRYLGAEDSVDELATGVIVPDLNTRPLHEFLGIPFTISQSLNENVTINIAYDRALLILENAGIGIKSKPPADRDLFWTFKPLAPGKTTVTVTVVGILARFSTTITYDLTIWPLVDPSLPTLEE